MIYRLFIKTIEWSLIALLGIMVVLVFGNVVLRYGFNSGLVFSEEVSRFIFMWLTLLGAMLAFAHRSHLGMNSVIAVLPLAGKRVVRFLSDAIMLGCCVLLAWGTWLQVVLAMADHAPVTGVPMGIVFSALLVCSIGMALMLIHSLWLQISGQMPEDQLVDTNTEVVE